MKKVLAVVPAVAMVTCLFSADAVRAPLAEAQESVQQVLTVAGTWTFNVEKSDDARERMSAATRNQGPADAGRVGRGAAGGRSGGSRGGRGGAMDPPAGGGAPQMRGSAMVMLQGPREMQIEFTETSVILHRDGGVPLEVTTDGKPLTVGLDAGKIEYKAKWNGKKLEVDTRVEDGPRVTEAYELDKSDPGVLNVEVRFTSPSPAGNLNVKLNRVYDRG